MQIQNKLKLNKTKKKTTTTLKDRNNAYTKQLNYIQNKIYKKNNKKN